MFLDLFVRCYYGILKYNYKHFISVKVFYWQLHEVHAKSQYLQCWPFFFKISAIRPGILSINFWATSWLMAAHSCIINAWSLSEFVWFLFVHLPLEDWPQILNGIKVWGVSWPWTQNFNVLFPEPLSYHFSLWQGAPSGWKRHCSSPNCSWMVGRSCSRRMFWYHSLFMAVLLGKIVIEPTPLAEKQPHTWMVSGCFTVGMTQDGSAHIFFSRQDFFRMPQTIGKGIHQRKLLYPSPQQSNPCTFCRISVCPWCFSWREVASLLPFLDTRSSPTSLRLTVCADALTPACCHSWASSALVVPRSRSWINFRRWPWRLLDFLGRPEAVFTTIDPLSLNHWHDVSRSFWGRAERQWKCFFGD